MLTTICITILAYMLLGKEIKPLLAKLEGVDWRRKASDILDPIKVYANRVGRTAVQRGRFFRAPRSRLRHREKELPK